MDKREWLASKGLAQAGSRGRFSREAEAAWANHQGPQDIEGQITIEEAIEAELPRDGFTLAKLPENKPVIRKEDLAYSISDRGTIIAHGQCGKCKERINKCDCGGPWSPKWLDPTQRPYLLEAE
jgi:hypothetical protein